MPASEWPATWLAFLGGPAPYEPTEWDDEPVDPYAWLKGHGWPPERPRGPRPVLTPEEHTEAPLTADQRQRRAELLARVRSANHPGIR
ncbi:hypothetical protein ACIF6L_26340 [Kitasatospora sp. NPDC086009]|uniref:hypothetical protein n=1 Tax=unclassified Kitasatospora TaxID=2633591 RepID=UPI0037C50D92